MEEVKRCMSPPLSDPTTAPGPCAGCPLCSCLSGRRSGTPAANNPNSPNNQRAAFSGGPADGAASSFWGFQSDSVRTSFAEDPYTLGLCGLSSDSQRFSFRQSDTPPNPAYPASSSYPANPGNPAYPANPVNSDNPVNSANPTYQAYPANPAYPAYPGNPAYAVNPGYPVRPLKATHQPKRPRRIFLVRHGQSVGNVDASVFTSEADWRVPLTEQGFEEAEACGRRIREIIETNHRAESSGDEHSDWRVFFYVSPYTRTLQTLRGIGRAFEQDRILGVREEPRLREQDFGNFQVQERMEMTKDARERFGKFFFRFPEGESAADVYDRVTGFLDSFWRDIEWGRMHPSLRQDGQMMASPLSSFRAFSDAAARNSFADAAGGGGSSSVSMSADAAVRESAAFSVSSVMRTEDKSESTRPMAPPDPYSGKVASDGRGGIEVEPGTIDATGGFRKESCDVQREVQESFVVSRESPVVESGAGALSTNGAAFVGTTGLVDAIPGPTDRLQTGCEAESAARSSVYMMGDTQNNVGIGSVGPTVLPMLKGGRKVSVNVVMVTHGLTSRVFLMRWFRWTVAQFEGLSNPRNCEIRVMQLADGGRYSLALQHTEDEMLAWGLSPCMVADQLARSNPGDRIYPTQDAPPPWACFFDHIPRPSTCENDINLRNAPSGCNHYDTPI